MKRTKNNTGALFLIPTPLMADAIQTLSPQLIAVVHRLQYFIVENARTARRFIKSTNPVHPIDTLQITELNKHTEDDLQALLAPLLEGNDVGVMSEVGCPGIADPGSKLVLRAHQHGVGVVPLTGPSSIILTLMASGMNGQRFHFHGYLSPKKEHLASDLRKLEEISRRDRATQIFIETPYRNQQVLEVAMKILSPSTLFCIGVDLTSETEMVRTFSISAWKKNPLPDLHKRPTVFCLEAK
jgi:16S rRNA (cytidine1402-2'-O)-methyltransferase